MTLSTATEIEQALNESNSLWEIGDKLDARDDRVIGLQESISEHAKKICQAVCEAHTIAPGVAAYITSAANTIIEKAARTEEIVKQTG